MLTANARGQKNNLDQWIELSMARIVQCKKCAIIYLLAFHLYFQSHNEYQLYAKSKWKAKNNFFKSIEILPAVAGGCKQRNINIPKIDKLAAKGMARSG